MANWQAVNVLSGTTENPKYVEVGTPASIWVATLTTALANGDTILGPSLPAGSYLCDLGVDCQSLDSSTGLTFEAGYTGALGAFIGSSTVGQGGGVAKVSVGGSLGFTAATNTQILVTITHAATTPVAGKMAIYLEYTASP